MGPFRFEDDCPKQNNRFVGHFQENKLGTKFQGNRLGSFSWRIKTAFHIKKRKEMFIKIQFKYYLVLSQRQFQQCRAC